MSKFIVMAVKQVIVETEIEANTQSEAWDIANKMGKQNFLEIKDEQAWKIKDVYQSA